MRAISWAVVVPKMCLSVEGVGLGGEGCEVALEGFDALLRLFEAEEPFDAGDFLGGGDVHDCLLRGCLLV